MIATFQIAFRTGQCVLAQPGGAAGFVTLQERIGIPRNMRLQVNLAEAHFPVGICAGNDVAMISDFKFAMATPLPLASRKATCRAMVCRATNVGPATD